jgi:hypothetical protein
LKSKDLGKFAVYTVRNPKLFRGAFQVLWVKIITGEEFEGKKNKRNNLFFLLKGLLIQELHYPSCLYNFPLGT